MPKTIKPSTENVSDPQTYDDAVMTILSQLDHLQGLANSVGDNQLAGQLEAVFHACLTRYCDSKHADLSTQMRHHFMPPKLYMN